MHGRRFLKVVMSTHILLNVTYDKEMRVAIVRERRLEALIHERPR